MLAKVKSLLVGDKTKPSLESDAEARLKAKAHAWLKPPPREGRAPPATHDGGPAVEATSLANRITNKTRTTDAEATEAKKKVKKSAPAKGSKRGQKGAPKEEEEKPAEQTEAEKRALEQEEKKKLEEEARELQRPKTYSSEEMEEYQQFAAELEQFLGDLTVR